MSRMLVVAIFIASFMVSLLIILRYYLWRYRNKRRAAEELRLG